MELPTDFYWLVGVLVVANLGSIIAVFGMGVKAIWWLSKLDSRMANVESRLEHQGEDLDEHRREIRDLQVLVPVRSRP